MDRITESQEWIDGLVREYAKSEDIDVDLQNMGLEIDSLREETIRLRTELNQQKVYEESMYESLQHALDRGLSLEIAQLDQNGKTVGWSPFNSDNHNLRDWPVSRFRVVPAPAAVPEDFLKAVRRLVVAARTSGGTSGPDFELIEACTECEAVLFESETAIRSERLPKASGVSRVYDGERQIDGLVMVSFSRAITDDELRALHDFLGSEPASRSESEIKAEALEDLADWIDDYVGEAYDEAGQERPMVSAITSRHVRTRSARLRGEGEES